MEVNGPGLIANKENSISRSQTHDHFGEGLKITGKGGEGRGTTEGAWSASEKAKASVDARDSLIQGVNFQTPRPWTKGGGLKKSSPMGEKIGTKGGGGAIPQ